MIPIKNLTITMKSMDIIHHRMFISGSEIKHKTPLGPQLAANIFPPVNSLVTISNAPNSRSLPYSSLVQRRC